MKPSIVFVGFMGAGKSTALRAAAAEGLSTVEIDELMEKSFGSTIPQAFERHGEEGFRARESEVVGSLLENADDGGAAGGPRAIGGEGGHQSGLPAIGFGRLRQRTNPAQHSAAPFGGVDGNASELAQRADHPACQCRWYRHR